VYCFIVIINNVVGHSDDSADLGAFYAFLISDLDTFVSSDLSFVREKHSIMGIQILIAIFFP
jgi:hypothetical protein